jgi:putative membrane protein
MTRKSRVPVSLAAGLVAAGVAFVSPSFAAGPEMPTPGAATTVPPSPGTPSSEPGNAAAPGQQQLDTKTYVQQAAMTDLFEVKAGELALQKSKDGGVKNFARLMVKDHTRTTKKLQAALKKGGADVSPPMELDAEHADMLKQLQGLGGADFDKTYIQMQVDGHQKALALHQGYAASGENATLKKLAGKTAKIVSHHLEEAKALEGGSSG